DRLTHAAGGAPGQGGVDDTGGDAAVALAAEVAPEEDQHHEDRQLSQGARANDQNAVAQRSLGQRRAHGRIVSWPPCQPRMARRAFSAGSSPAASSTSATSWARSATGSGTRTATTTSSASWTCTR